MLYNWDLIVIVDGQLFVSHLLETGQAGPPSRFLSALYLVSYIEKGQLESQIPVTTFHITQLANIQICCTIWMKLMVNVMKIYGDLHNKCSDKSKHMELLQS